MTMTKSMTRPDAIVPAAWASELPRILLVGDHFGYPGGVSHGVTTYFLEVLPALAEAGVELSACFLREPHPAADALREHGIVPTFLSVSRWDPTAALRIAAIARQSGSTVLHAAGMKGALMARMATRLVPARTLLHVHDLLYPGPLVGNLHRLFARRSDMAVCVSRAAIPVAADGYHVERDRVRVVHNGIRLQRFRNVSSDARRSVRQSLNIAETTHVLLVVGRMYPIKGHRTMLRMMPGIVERCPDAVLLLAGDGPEREPCEALAAELGLRDHVRFLGQRGDIPELLAASDIVALPSESEGFPISAIEALATGRPVVAFGVGGVPEVVVDGETGRVVPPADTVAFVNATVALMHDDDSRAAFGLHARRAAEEFTLDAHVQQLLNCYREVAATDGVEPLSSGTEGRRTRQWE